MKKILIAAAAVLTLTGAAGAASAQSYDRYDRYDRGGQSINGQQQQIRHKIERGVRHGAITRREAQRLEMQLRDISRQERQFRASRGLDRREVAILDSRLDRLNRQVTVQARDGQRYGYGYGDRRW